MMLIFGLMDVRVCVCNFIMLRNILSNLIRDFVINGKSCQMRFSIYEEHDLSPLIHYYKVKCVLITLYKPHLDLVVSPFNDHGGFYLLILWDFCIDFYVSEVGLWFSFIVP